MLPNNKCYTTHTKLENKAIAQIPSLFECCSIDICLLRASLNDVISELIN